MWELVVFRFRLLSLGHKVLVCLGGCGSWIVQQQSVYMAMVINGGARFYTLSAAPS
jgi:hypothetical protein